MWVANISKTVVEKTYLSYGGRFTVQFIQLEGDLLFHLYVQEEEHMERLSQ